MYSKLLLVFPSVDVFMSIIYSLLYVQYLENMNFFLLYLNKKINLLSYQLNIFSQQHRMGREPMMAFEGQ